MSQSDTTQEQIDVEEIRRKYDTEARYRKLIGKWAIIISLIAIVFSLFQYYTAGFGLLLALKQRTIHLSFVMALIFLLYPFSPKKIINRIPWYDIVLAIIGAGTVLYIDFNFQALISRAGLPTWYEIVIGTISIILILEATRRIISPILPIVAIFFIFYAYAGPIFPGIFAHRPYDFSRIINHLFLGTEGIFGVPIGVASTFVFLFILFGAFLEKTGMGKFLIDISLALAGRYTGGPAKVAVVSSGLLGSISGSSVANVCTTGAFTIPLMKSIGYKPYFAGAVEATASTGGQIMPPVMGAAAFIMAEFVGIPYIYVAIAAIIPATLYYTSVMIQVHLEAKRLGLKGVPKERLPQVKKVMKERGHLLIPVGILIYLLVAGYTPLMAAFWGINSTVIIGWLKKETRLGLKDILDAFEAGAKSALGVSAACATVGMVVGVATLTGLGLRIANAILTLSHGNLFLTMLFTMFASILLGAGLPTTANYIVTSTIAAPALLKLGVNPLAAHMFVFYYGIAADLSPPVALAAYAGAGIARGEPMKTGMTAMKLAIAGFIVPYLYVYNPTLLLVNLPDANPIHLSIPILIIVLIKVVIAVLMLGAASIGYFEKHLNKVERLLAVIAAVLLLIHIPIYNYAGIVVAIVFYFVQHVKKDK